MSEYISGYNEMKYAAYSLLDDTGLVRHGFMTRLGGVSTGFCESMNLSFEREDAEENVIRNFSLAASCFGTDTAHVVTAAQTHTANIRVMHMEDAGKGVIYERDYSDTDGLITNEPGLMLSTGHADCTPVFLLDPVNKAIGMVHSGWRGTAERISENAVRAMTENYGTDPADLIAAIGPCICGSCYEIGSDVADIFLKTFDGDHFMLTEKKDGRYLLDLKKANRRVLEDAGVRSGNIDVSGLCTFERTDLFFSHRKMGLKRGQMSAFIMLV